MPSARWLRWRAGRRCPERRRRAEGLSPPSKAAARASTAAGIEVIDESYNANPASMAAALALLGMHAKGGRSIAVLGDMLEMGAGGMPIMPALPRRSKPRSADLVFAQRRADESAVGVLPASRRGAYAANLRRAAPQAAGRAGKPGDTVLVKGSNGQQDVGDRRCAESARRELSDSACLLSLAFSPTPTSSPSSACSNI